MRTCLLQHPLRRSSSNTLTAYTLSSWSGCFRLYLILCCAFNTDMLFNFRSLSRCSAQIIELAFADLALLDHFDFRHFGAVKQENPLNACAIRMAVQGD